MNSTGYELSRVHYVKGRVEQTLGLDADARTNATLPNRIAILRLDTDFYASTHAEMNALWPRVVAGGWLYVDDYFDFGGARTAINSWLTRSGWHQAARDAGAVDRRTRSFHLVRGADPAHPFVRVARGPNGSSPVWDA